MSYLPPLTIAKSVCLLSLALFLHSNFYVMFLSTHGPTNSEPTNLVQDGHVF